MSSPKQSQDEFESASDQFQILCEKFADLTNTDLSCAQFYLNVTNRDLEVAVKEFNEDRDSKGVARISQDNFDSEDIYIFSDCTGNEETTTKSNRIFWEASSRSKSESESEEERIDSASAYPRELKLISWSTDGRIMKERKSRMKAICEKILREEADVVLLQEVIPETAADIEEQLPDYKCLFSDCDEVDSFSAALLNERTIQYESHEDIDLRTRQLMKNALVVNAIIGKIPLCLITSQSGSAWKERKDQLLNVLQGMLEKPIDRTIIFGGDLSLSDNELGKIGGLPTGVEDVWELCGRPMECYYTFETTEYENASLDGEEERQFRRGKVNQFRFDRVFIRDPVYRKVTPKLFQLIGFEKLIPQECFPSRHRGIFCRFGLEQ